jgi:hypothetical protein
LKEIEFTRGHFRTVEKKFNILFQDFECENKYVDALQNETYEHKIIMSQYSLHNENRIEIIPPKYKTNPYHMFEEICEKTETKFESVTVKGRVSLRPLVTYIVGYNNQGYDMPLLLKYILDNRNKHIKIYKIVFHRGYLIEFVFSYKDHLFSVTDLGKIIGVESLAFNAKQFKCENQKHELSYPYTDIKKLHLMEPPKRDELIRYGLLDIIVLKELFYKVEDTFKDLIDNVLELKYNIFSLNQFYSCSHLSFYLLNRYLTKQNNDIKLILPNKAIQYVIEQSMYGSHNYINDNMTKEERSNIGNVSEDVLDTIMEIDDKYKIFDTKYSTYMKKSCIEIDNVIGEKLYNILPKTVEEFDYNSLYSSVMA